MKKTLLRSKLHRINVTQVELDYEGSCAVDVEILAKGNMQEYEKIPADGKYHQHFKFLPHGRPHDDCARTQTGPQTGNTHFPMNFEESKTAVNT